MARFAILALLASAAVFFTSADARQRPTHPSSPFLVTGKLLNVTKGPISYAGYLPVEGILPARSLFFWYFEPPKPSDKVAFWFNGGPGCSSQIGLFEENGPWVRNNKTGKLETNKYGWNNEAHIIYVDQPLGTGASFGPANLVNNTVEAATNFYGFLKSFYKAFPLLLKKELYITGESYAGYYVPYFAKAIADGNKNQNNTLKLNLRAIGIGNAVVNDYMDASNLGTLALFDAENLWASKNDPNRAKFIEGLKTCGIPVLSANNFVSSDHYVPASLKDLNWTDKKILANKTLEKYCFGDSEEDQGIFNYTLGLYNSVCFDYYDVDDRSCWSEDPDVETFYNDPTTRASLHIQSKETFQICNNAVTGHIDRGDIVDKVPFTDNLFDGLIKAGVKVVLYSGSRDAVVPHITTELAIETAKWGGKIGFEHHPMEPFMVGGKKVGKIHTERGLTYVLIFGAGHEVPYYQPKAAFAMFKDHILTL